MVESKASSTRRCAFDGDVVVDEFRAFDPSGAVVFRGVSLGHWVGLDRKRIVWVMVGDAGITFLDDHLQDGVLVSSGFGRDGMGSFEERSRTTWGDDGTSEFVMDRLYPAMGVWIEPLNRIVATPSEEAVPPEPFEPSPLLALGSRFWDLGESRAEVRRCDLDGGVVLGVETRRSRLILDGTAVLTEVELQETGSGGARVRRWIRFGTVDEGPVAWREMSWELGTESLTMRTQPLDDPSTR